MLKIYTDGASSGNPGPGWAMWVIGKAQGPESKIQIIKEKRIRLEKCTNNEAEYKAVIFSLEDLVANPNLWKNESKIVFQIDSTLVVQQLNGLFKVKSSQIREYIFKINILLAEINIPVIFQYIPREQNLADKLKNI